MPTSTPAKKPRINISNAFLPELSYNIDCISSAFGAYSMCVGASERAFARGVSASPNISQNSVSKT